MKTKSPTPKKKMSPEALYRSEFAGRLKQAAENHDIGDLASKIGVTPATLYRWLNGKFDPSLPKLSHSMNRGCLSCYTGLPTNRHSLVRRI